MGKFLEYPEIMTQGKKTIKEFEENLEDAFFMMAMDDVPGKYKTREIVI